MPNYSISIDPGIELGFSVWKQGDSKSSLPVEIGRIGAEKGADWFDRIHSIVERLGSVYDRYKGDIKRTDIEYPQYFDTGGGYMVAKRGDLVKLVYAAGLIGGVAVLHGSTVSLHKVHVWKGQLPKPVVEKRIRERIPNIDSLKPYSHEWDAIGIGLHAKGVKLDS